MNTTIKSFLLSTCEISDKGAESLARVLAVNRSLKQLHLGWTTISDTGAAHISTALCVNSSLELLEVDGDTTTDAAVLSLVDALKTNTSLKNMDLQWSSTHPDYTLKLMVDVFKETNLKRVSLGINMVHLPINTVSLGEQVEEWYQRVEVGGKELILSMGDNHHLETLYLKFFTRLLVSSSFSALRLETRTSLEAAVASINSVRSEKGYSALNFSCNIL